MEYEWIIPIDYWVIPSGNQTWLAGKSKVPQPKWVCLKIVYPFLPNGFADHYPYEKWLFHWED